MGNYYFVTLGDIYKNISMCLSFKNQGKICFFIYKKTRVKNFCSGVKGSSEEGKCYAFIYKIKHLLRSI